MKITEKNLSETRTIRQGKGQSWGEVPGSQRPLGAHPKSHLFRTTAQEMSRFCDASLSPFFFSPGTSVFARRRLSVLCKTQSKHPGTTVDTKLFFLAVVRYTLNLNRPGHFFSSLFSVLFLSGASGGPSRTERKWYSKSK